MKAKGEPEPAFVGIRLVRPSDIPALSSDIVDENQEELGETQL
jgi:hypothetical protein